jgi:hypothetical protein
MVLLSQHGFGGAVLSRSADRRWRRDRGLPEALQTTSGRRPISAGPIPPLLTRIRFQEGISRPEIFGETRHARNLHNFGAQKPDIKFMLQIYIADLTLNLTSVDCTLFIVHWGEVLRELFRYLMPKEASSSLRKTSRVPNPPAKEVR